MSNENKWELFSHGADIGVRGYGTTLADAFIMGAMALTAVVTDPAQVTPLTAISVTCTAPDEELLFVDWLNAIVYEMDSRRMLFSHFDVHIHRLNLTATIKGEFVNRKKHQPAVDLKGATYTELKVKKRSNVWIAQCIIDV